MAGGWSRDGAEQEQIEATINDALERARLSIPHGESASFCEECEKPIPKARQIAIPGVQHCVQCQQELEEHAKKFELFNRRGSVQKTVSFPYTVKNRNDTLWQIPLTLKQP